MKKIMIVLAAIIMGLSVSAAQVSWKTGAGIKEPTSATDGAFSGTNAKTGTLAMYVWLVNQEVYNATDVANIYSTYGADLGSATGAVTGKGGSLGVTVKTTGLAFDTEKSTTYYALVLTTYESGDVKGYIANKATAIINTAGSDASITDLANGGTGWTMLSTTPVVPGGEGGVPEPTSGLLLIVGGALLALRRKQK